MIKQGSASSSASSEIFVTDFPFGELNEEKIAGAGLDVFKEEPLPDNHPLLSLPARIEKRIILTPHAAFYSREAETELRKSIMDQLLTALAGKKPPHVVNPQAW